MQNYTCWWNHSRAAVKQNMQEKINKGIQLPFYYVNLNKCSLIQQSTEAGFREAWIYMEIVVWCHWIILYQGAYHIYCQWTDQILRSPLIITHCIMPWPQTVIFIMLHQKLSVLRGCMKEFLFVLVLATIIPWFVLSCLLPSLQSLQLCFINVIVIFQKQDDKKLGCHWRDSCCDCSWSIRFVGPNYRKKEEEKR